MQTIRLGRAVLGARTLTSVENGLPVSMNFDEDFDSLLSVTASHVATALAIIFSRDGTNLAISTAGYDIELIPSGMQMHDHFSALAMRYRIVVAQLKERVRTLSSEKRAALLDEQRAVGQLIQAYCAYASFASKLTPNATLEASDILPAEYIASSTGVSPFVSRTQWEEYQADLQAAEELEARLPLEIQFGLDGDPRNLPTARVRAREPGKSLRLARRLPVPVVSGVPLRDSTYRMAMRVGGDIKFERADQYFEVSSYLKPWQLRGLVGSLTDREEVLDSLANQLHDTFALKTRDGSFRVQRTRLKGSAVYYCLRPMESRPPAQAIPKWSPILPVASGHVIC